MQYPKSSKGKKTRGFKTCDTVKSLYETRQTHRPYGVHIVPEGVILRLTQNYLRW